MFCNDAVFFVFQFQGGRKNPFVVVPSYNNWAPWIGPKTRRDDTVFNTEHEKFHAPRQATEMADLQMTEERLQDALVNLKVMAGFTDY